MDDYPSVHRDPAPDLYGRLRVEDGDLGPARWIGERFLGGEHSCTVAGVVVPGFDAYVRVLHPASLEGRAVRWRDVAEAQGRPLGVNAGWHEVIGAERDYPNVSEYGLPGVWDEHPVEGPTPAAVAEALIPVLARHTRTAEQCWFGLWEGYGRWDFSRFPTFETPHRGEVLLAGALSDAVSPVAWDEFAELPDLWWPQDRAWCVGGDVDLVSTCVGGSQALIEELLADGELETHRVAPGDPVY
ncbi:hypothetical protein D0Z67_00200 [Streptomyces seoulensis]|uniref:Uncharacterized protein n=1 Tax=Streptomyces seoulensis TaxID=73044 RepID=A0A4P6TRW3_STRSO|nr:hypothetical protein [Streptomyces seoulensis]QBJ88901.1 hypothetical protein D0Z67_00200 [Streptomyces seoulensis]